MVVLQKLLRNAMGVKYLFSVISHFIDRSARKEVMFVEWITPDFEEYETSCEVTAYAYHW